MKLMDKLEAKDGEMLDRSATTIISQVEALRKLVDAFGDYAREPEFEVADLNLEQLIKVVVALYRGRLRLGVQGSCRFPVGLILVKAPLDRLGQVGRHLRPLDRRGLQMIF